MTEAQEKAIITLKTYAALLTLDVETAPILTEQRREIGRFILDQLEVIQGSIEEWERMVKTHLPHIQHAAQGIEEGRFFELCNGQNQALVPTIGRS